MNRPGAACGRAWVFAALCGGCASAAPKAAAPSFALMSPVTLVATPIAPVVSNAPPAEPAPSSEPAEPPPLAPLPTPEPPPATPPSPSTARVLLADELPFYAVRGRPHDPEHRRPPTHEGQETTRKESRRRPSHPPPGIVVDVVDAQGGVPAADLQRVARNNGYWPFRQCYEEGLRRDQRLAGKVSFELVVNPGGGVDRSTVTASTVRDEIVGACVAREARHLGLPTSGWQTTAKVDVSLAVGDEPTPTARPVPNAESLRHALRASWDAARQCYANELTGHPDAGGRLELRFRMRKDGAVFEVAETSDRDARFSDAGVTGCVLGVYRTAKLPELPRGPHDRSFVYAMHFESKPDEPVAP